MSRLNVGSFRHPDATADAITLTNGGDTQINRALGLGGATYGTSGQFLQSQGSGAAPQWATPAAGATLTVGTMQSASGNSSISFESFPSNTELIEIHLYQVSWNATASLRWQIGDSGGYEAAGYQNQTMYFLNGSSPSASTSTGSFGYNTWTSSSHEINGIIKIYTRGTTGQHWLTEGIAESTLNGNEMMMHVGTKSLSGQLDRVQVFPSNSASFDGGQIQFNYWTA